MIVNFAERAHNHNWELDPVIRSLLDTDFYKLLMLQFIWKHFPTTHVTFSVVNRTGAVRLADMFSREELGHQMEHVRRLRFRRSELVWLAGNTFYGRRGIFEPAFLEWLEQDFRLSDYEISVHDGQYDLTFDGLWLETTMWELYTLHSQPIEGPCQHEKPARIWTRHSVCEAHARWGQYEHFHADIYLNANQDRNTNTYGKLERDKYFVAYPVANSHKNWDRYEYTNDYEYQHLHEYEYSHIDIYSHPNGFDYSDSYVVAFAHR